MKETGKVVEVTEGIAKIRIKRHTACGSCGACQVGQEKLEMILSAENLVNAQVGDEVEVDIETTNFLTAVLIGYGIPLLGLIAGVLLGYFLAPLFGFSDITAQGIAAITGLLVMAGSYYLIRMNEEKIKKIKKFNPAIVRIVEADEKRG